MGLKLKEVPAAAGWQWITLALQEYWRHPVAYAGLLVSYLLSNLGVLVVASLLANIHPALFYVGGALVVMAIPLLTLAFVMGTHEAQQGRLLHIGLYVLPWMQRTPDRRRPLLLLLLAFLVATLVSFQLAGVFDNQALDQLQDAMAKGPMTDEEVTHLFNSPELTAALAWRSLAIAVVSIPFWFAPVLVFWGGQGPAQAMFSSLVALWRARAAFFLYFLGGMGALMLISMLAGFVLALLGPGVAGLLAIPLGLVLPAIFYVSLYFSFRDCFGEP
jgi:MFS family permease